MCKDQSGVQNDGIHDGMPAMRQVGTGFLAVFPVPQPKLTSHMFTTHMSKIINLGMRAHIW